MDNAFTSYKMEERSFVAYIKREIHARVAKAHFTVAQAGEIDIIVSELTSNIIKHAGQGELLFRVNDLDESTSSVEMVAIDNGNGIADTNRMLKDGVSTTHTLGHGLGAINRLSNIAQLYSIPGWGTILYAAITTKIPARKSRTSNLNVDVRGLCVNKPRENVCGDGYRIKHTPLALHIFFGDGLGHGIHAKNAIDQAGEIFVRCVEEDPVEIIRVIHENVKRTRGLVGLIASCDFNTKQWRLCGVGNIFTRIYSGMGFQNYMSYNGTIGLNIPNSMNASTFAVEPNQHLISCSDGIQSRWDLAKYPAILKYDNTILAAAIYKDYTRGNDDSSVLIAKVS